MNAPAIACRGLFKRYPEVVAVAGLELEVARGECFGLLGPNGAGKTTTVEMLEGLTTPDEGSIELFGVRWGAGQDSALRARIGVQLQETQLSDRLTVEETLRLFRSFYPRGREVDEVIGLLALEDKRRARVGKLSGGQRQRLALGCALVSAPDLLFLDEPTTGLDPQARRSIWEVARRFLAAGGTILLTTHYMEEAAQLCGRVAIMDAGRIIALGTPAELVRALGVDLLVEMQTDGPLDAEALAAAGLVVSGSGELGYRARLPSGDALPRLLALLHAQGRQLLRLETHAPTLEDVFLERTGRSLSDE